MTESFCIIDQNPFEVSKFNLDNDINQYNSQR